MPVSFASPHFLALLLLLPLVWLIGRRSLAGLEPGRRRAALALRMSVVALLAFAAAELEWRDLTKNVEVIFVVDHSRSIPDAQARLALEAINKSRERMDPRRDRAKVVVFGREGLTEGTLRKEQRPLARYASDVDRDATDIEAGLRAALGALDVDARGRIILLSDGNATAGDAAAALAQARSQGVSVDVVPLEYAHSNEVLVDKVIVPSEAKIGEPFVVRVLVESQQATEANVHLWQEGALVETRRVQLAAGRNVEKFQLTLGEAGFFGIQAVVEPLGAATGDRVFQNNTAHGFVFARGKAQVLLVHDDSDAVGLESRHLLAALRAEEIRVKAIPAIQFPLRVGELQSYDAIILDDVAAPSLSASQQEGIEQAVGDMGLGLIMIGGPRSFGPGEWRGSPVERALPVEMDIKQEEVIPDGALVMIMHSCEIEQGNAMAIKVCQRAIDGLSAKDHVGVLIFGNGSEWAVPLQQARNKRAIKKAIQNMLIGDMPDFDEIFRMALKGLEKTEAAVKHMIIMSDGDPSPPAPSLLKKCQQERITVSTICYGAHGGSQGPSVDAMKRIANVTGGKYYYLDDINQLPQIFLKESKKVTRPLIVNKTFTPVARTRSGVLAGLRDLPPVTGYVLTEAKPRAEVALVSPDDAPVLAHWQYGVGKSLAFTSDARPRWATEWVKWEGFRPFWSQAVRWVSKDVKESLFQVRTSLEGDRGQVVLDAVTAEGEVVDGLIVTANVAGPDGEPREVRLQQRGAGRYEAEFPLEGVGTHSVSLLTLDEDGQRRHSVTTGLVVPYSEEFRKLASDRAALEELARAGGGRVIEPAQLIDWSVDPWDRASLGEKEALEERWPLALALALGLFLLDVGVRRVAIDWAKLVARARAALPGGRKPNEPTLDRLRARKDAVREQRREELAKFEPGAAASSAPPVQVAGGAPAPARPQPVPPKPTQLSADPTRAPGEEGYTNRLLEAKRRARRNREDEERRSGGAGDAS